jgi:hypothetical protein
MSPERGEVGAPGFPGWKFTKAIKLDTSASGANVAGTVANYPVAVLLTAMNFDFAQAKDAGEDIRFGKADGTPIPYAVESWDKAGGKAAIWVKVDSIAGGNNSQSINMYWGNAGAGDASDSKGVFGAEFVGTWHLNEDGSTAAGGYKDASAAGNHGTGMNLMPGSRVDGVIGSGTRTKNAMRQWVNVPDPDRRFRPANFTASIWAWADAFNARWGSGGSPGYQCVMSSGEGWTVQRETGGRFESCFANAACSIGRAMNTKEWVHFVLVKNGGNHSLYMNAARVAGGGAPNRMDLKDLGLGQMTQYLDPVRHVNEQRSWEGILDEARVMNVAASTDWIKLDYESQKPGSKFLVFGPVQMR